MILINLLPHREAARKRRKEVFNVSLGAAALLGGIIAGVIFLWYQASISSQQDNNVLLETEIKKLEAQIKDIVGLEAEIAALRARQQAVEDLQSDRNLPVHLLTEIVNQLPDGVYISKLIQQDQTVTLNGTAQSNERVAELLRNLAVNTPWFTKPELIEIVSGIVVLPPKEQKRVSNFVIKVRLVRASEAEKAIAKDIVASAQAASAPNAPSVEQVNLSIAHMPKNTHSKIDFAELQQKLVAQFTELDPKDPSVWPILPRYSLFVGTAIVVVVTLWFLWLSGSQEILVQEQEKEVKLKEDYKIKLGKSGEFGRAQEATRTGRAIRHAVRKTAAE